MKFGELEGCQPVSCERVNFLTFIQKWYQMHFVPNKNSFAYVQALNFNYIWKILLALNKYKTEKPEK